MATPTTEEIIEQRGREREALRKLGEVPGELTAGDCTDLPAQALSEAIASGALAHLGYGADKRRRR